MAEICPAGGYDIIWITPPENQGQIVEVSYSRDCPDGIGYERTLDRSDGSESIRPVRSPDDCEWEPWNGTPEHQEV